ncbi:TPA: hypothetical protein DCL30_02965 [Candidatus Peribacteria bacterium]|nr:MAG: hypothetical protein A3J91_00215 [Candidatus Peribacteria bacterium RIFOXYC2_FULL_58_10]OGJ83819.1 MAG: hypothetical protein A2529_05745 [Candidatus Peribacteria bacterium RIFOXYD2_FULL_58_15]HAI98481.1 hypothetical protein [Candidatus Peribacteria bacterium]HAS34193.1 hypothetical protein [Candidatus Peribacteria bacterium]
MASETLTWAGMPHSFVLTETPMGLFGELRIVKPRGTQSVPVPFPGDVTLQNVLGAWKGNWEDLFPPVKSPGTFSVIRFIDLGKYRVLWYVLHVYDAPQDACAVLPKPPAVGG